MIDYTVFCRKCKLGRARTWTFIKLKGSKLHKRHYCTEAECRHIWDKVEGHFMVIVIRK